MNIYIINILQLCMYSRNYIWILIKTVNVEFLLYSVPGSVFVLKFPERNPDPSVFFLPSNCTPDKFIHVPKGILMEICIKYIHVEILMTMCQISRTAKTSLKVSGFRHRISPPDFYFFFAEWPRLKILQRTAIRGDAVSRHHGPPWNPCQTSRQYGTEGFKQGP